MINIKQGDWIHCQWTQTISQCLSAEIVRFQLQSLHLPVDFVRRAWNTSSCHWKALTWSQHSPTNYRCWLMSIYHSRPAATAVSRSAESDIRPRIGVWGELSSKCNSFHGGCGRIESCGQIKGQIAQLLFGWNSQQIDPKQNCREKLSGRFCRNKLPISVSHVWTPKFQLTIALGAEKASSSWAILITAVNKSNAFLVTVHNGWMSFTGDLVCLLRKCHKLYVTCTMFVKA